MRSVAAASGTIVSGILLCFGSAGADTVDPIYANSFEVGVIAFGPPLSFVRAPSMSAQTVDVPLQVTLSGPAAMATFVPIVSTNPAVIAISGGGVTVAIGQSSATVLVDGVAGSATPVTLWATLGNKVGAAVRVEQALNETGGDEAEFCVLQYPVAFDVGSGAIATVYGQLFEAGVTEPAGPPAGWTAQVGFGPLGSDPRDLAGWKFFDAAYNIQFGDNDEFQASFTAPDTLGQYSYVYRFSSDGGNTFTYCDTNAGDGGSGSNPGLTFSPADLGIMTVADPFAGLVINEVDYDQIATDTTEFIEIYNGSNHAIDLGTLAIVLVNGTGNTEYARVNLGTAGSLAAGQYLVAKSSNVVSSGAALVVLFPGTDNQIQNGAPDGIALVDTASFRLIDALSYEGAIFGASVTGFPIPLDLVEGTALSAAVADSNTGPGSLSRLPNGADTDDADTDWKFSLTPTPGAANQ
jgi:hypothetical protein